jgi:transcriptional regulator with XRE-family HTH domain
MAKSKPKPSEATSPLSDQLRAVIAGRKLSAFAVAIAAGLDPAIVSRFVARERSLSLASADRIAEALGLRLAEGRGGLR